MDILFKNSFTLTEKLILECRVAFISKWDKFFSLLFLFTSIFGFLNCIIKSDKYINKKRHL